MTYLKTWKNNNNPEPDLFLQVPLSCVNTLVNRFIVHILYHVLLVPVLEVFLFSLIDVYVDGLNMSSNCDIDAVGNTVNS